MYCTKTQFIANDGIVLTKTFINYLKAMAHITDDNKLVLDGPDKIIVGNFPDKPTKCGWCSNNQDGITVTFNKLAIDRKAIAVSLEDANEGLNILGIVSDVWGITVGHEFIHAKDFRALSQDVIDEELESGAFDERAYEKQEIVHTSFHKKYNFKVDDTLKRFFVEDALNSLNLISATLAMKHRGQILDGIVFDTPIARGYSIREYIHYVCGMPSDEAGIDVNEAMTPDMSFYPTDDSSPPIVVIPPPPEIFEINPDDVSVVGFATPPGIPTAPIIPEGQTIGDVIAKCKEEDKKSEAVLAKIGIELADELFFKPEPPTIDLDNFYGDDVEDNLPDYSIPEQKEDLSSIDPEYQPPGLPDDIPLPSPLPATQPGNANNAYQPTHIGEGDIVLGPKVHPMPFQNFITKLNDHLINKCGYEKGFYTNIGALSEPIPLTEHEQAFIKFVDKTNHHIHVAHAGFITGKMFGECPGYAFYMNVDGKERKFNFITQNTKITINGVLKWTAIEHLAGRSLSWLILKAKPGEKDTWVAKVRHIASTYCVLNKHC